MGCPPPTTSERPKSPQQTTYHWKENLSESPNHQKHWEIPWFRNSMSNPHEIGRIQATSGSSKKFQTPRTEHITHHPEARDPQTPNT